MNQDKSLKKNELKLIFLVCGNACVGKKTFVENIIKKLNQQEGLNFDNKSYYISYNFKINHKIDNDVISIPIEIRILNSNN
jgi:septin family protein